MRPCQSFLLLVVLAGCNSSDNDGQLNQSQADKPTEGRLTDTDLVKKEIKLLLPMAASMSTEDSERLVNSASIPTIDLMENQSLTTLVLMLHPNQLDVSREQLEKEFRWHSKPDPAAIINALTRTPGMTSVIQPGSVKAVTCQVHDGRAKGTVQVALKEVFDMQVNYVAVHDGQKWKIRTFELPNCQAKTELQPNGKWKASGLGVRPALQVSLPRVEVVGDREEVPHRRVIYLGRDKGDRNRLAIANEIFEVDELEQRLSLFYVDHNSQPGEDAAIPPEDVNLVIRADAQVDAGLAVDVLERCIAAGIREFRFQVTQPGPSGYTPFRSLGEIAAFYREAPTGGREFPPLPIKIQADMHGKIGKLLVSQDVLKDTEALSARLLEVLGSEATKDKPQFTFRIEVDYDLRYEELVKVLAACSCWSDGEGKISRRPFLWELSRREAVSNTDEK